MSYIQIFIVYFLSQFLILFLPLSLLTALFAFIAKEKTQIAFFKLSEKIFAALFAVSSAFILYLINNNAVFSDNKMIMLFLMPALINTYLWFIILISGIALYMKIMKENTYLPKLKFILVDFSKYILIFSLIVLFLTQSYIAIKI